jgi:hypothetical protein
MMRGGSSEAEQLFMQDQPEKRKGEEKSSPFLLPRAAGNAAGPQ